MDAANPIALVQAATATNTRGVPRLEQPKPPDEQAARLHKLEKAASDFEAIFLNQLLKPLAKSVSSSSQGSQLGGDVMMEVAMEKMAETLADKGGIGLGDLLLHSLKNRLIGDAIPPVSQGDTGPAPVKIMELEKDKIPHQMKLWPDKPAPSEGDELQTSQVR